MAKYRITLTDGTHFTAESEDLPVLEEDGMYCFTDETSLRLVPLEKVERIEPIPDGL